MPANVPGELLGSCSFVNRTGQPIEPEMWLRAQAAGTLAFDGARRIWSVRGQRDKPMPLLTDRQRECILWAARGKGDWEIARILGISEETVARHISQACARYGLSKRTPLTVRTIADGTITVTDAVLY